MHLIYVNMNSIFFSLIKLILPISYCSPSELNSETENENQSENDVEKIINQYNIIIGPNVHYDGNTHTTFGFGGLIIKVEIHDSDGVKSDLTANLALQGVYIALAFLSWSFYQKMKYLLEKKGIPKSIKFPIYTTLLLFSGVILLSGRALQAYTTELRRMEYETSEKLTVDIRNNGELVNMNDLNTLFKPVNHKLIKGFLKTEHRKKSGDF